ERVQATDGALGHGHVAPPEEVEDLARGADRRLDVAVGRRDDDAQDAEVLHGHEQDEREVVVDAAVVIHEDELCCHGMPPGFLMGSSALNASAPHALDTTVSESTRNKPAEMRITRG